MKNVIIYAAYRTESLLVLSRLKRAKLDPESVVNIAKQYMCVVYVLNFSTFTTYVNFPLSQLSNIFLLYSSLYLAGVQ